MSLGEARTYLQELINKDRATLGLYPVDIDPIASQMAQAHAEEMASHGYLSHWDRQGRPPDQRYTDAGGRDCVQENIYLLQDGGGIIEPVQPDAAPSFSRAEIENIEAAYFNQRPPDDSHRKNISAAGHTHVGIGLARAGREFGPSAIANCQEFLNKYIEADTIPKEAKVGERIRINGNVSKDATIETIGISREDAPQLMTVAELKRTRKYGVPSPFAIYRTDSALNGKRISITSDGRFALDVEISDEKKPGLYYVTIKVVNNHGRVLNASQRTILVK